MWVMLQQDEPDDYVVATGEHRTVRELVVTAFSMAGLDWERYVEIDQAYIRPSEVNDLQGDATKARERLGWVPTVSFEEMIREMLENDLALEGVEAKKHLQALPKTPA
jgi:GDPmannose 4,6-dehydratase